MSKVCHHIKLRHEVLEQPMSQSVSAAAAISVCPPVEK